MANYTYTFSAKAEVLGGQGTMENLQASFPANGKVLMDDYLPVSPDFNLSLRLETIETPALVYIKFTDPAGSGFKLALDGIVANASLNTMKTAIFEYPSVGAIAPEIHLVTTAPGRLQVFALGDPA